jgi:NTP pyrophosphatase (non-canonical NTP hydrolase)
MTDFKRLTEKYIAFRNERDWAKYHKPKDVALSLVLEAAELLELFQWKSDEETQNSLAQDREKLADELADIVGWALILAHDCNINLAEAIEHKIRKNAEKYPVNKARGRATKYTDL